MTDYDKAEQLAKDSLQEARNHGFNSNTPYDDLQFRHIIRMKVECLLAVEQERVRHMCAKAVCNGCRLEEPLARQEPDLPDEHFGPVGPSESCKAEAVLQLDLREKP